MLIVSKSYSHIIAGNVFFYTHAVLKNNHYKKKTWEEVSSFF